MPRGESQHNSHQGSRAGQAGGGGGSTASSSPTGAFIGNIWHCNCTPRRAAKFAQSRKENENKGRKYYTCAKKNWDEKCSFFLWNEDAQERERQAAVANEGGGGRNDEPPPQPGAQDGRGVRRSNTPVADPSSTRSGKQPYVPLSPRTPTSNPARPSSKKRSAREANFPEREEHNNNDDDEDDDGDALFRSLTEAEVEGIPGMSSTPAARPTAERAATDNDKTKQGPTTGYPTPGTTGGKTRSRVLPWTRQKKDGTLESFWAEPQGTPSKAPTTTSKKRVSFHEPEPVPERATTPVVVDDDDENKSREQQQQQPRRRPGRRQQPRTPKNPGQTTPPSSPPPAPPPPPSRRPEPATSRFRDALQDPADSESSLTREVLAELAGSSSSSSSSSVAASLVGPATLRRLRSILSRHDLRAQSCRADLEMARASLERSNAENAALQARVVSLEEEREHNRNVVKLFR